MAHIAHLLVGAELPLADVAELVGKTLSARTAGQKGDQAVWMLQANGWFLDLEADAFDELDTGYVLEFGGPDGPAADAAGSDAFDRLAKATPWKLVLITSSGTIAAVRPALAPTA